MPSRAERPGVREPRDLTRYDLWKKYVIGTRTRFDPPEPDSPLAQYGGQHYYFEEAKWSKSDGEPRIVAQVQPDFGTSDDDGRYLWSVLWDFADGPFRDHGKLDGRQAAKNRCTAIVREGVRAALDRRRAARDALAAGSADLLKLPPTPATFDEETTDDVPEGM